MKAVEPLFNIRTFCACLPLLWLKYRIYSATKGTFDVIVSKFSSCPAEAVHEPVSLTPPAVVIVTIPEDTGVTLKLSPKLIVPAVPTTELLSLITTPVPDATTPVKLEPSPTKEVAVTTPEELTCLDAISFIAILGVPVKSWATVATPATAA